MDPTSVVVAVISSGLTLVGVFVTVRVAGRANRTNAMLTWAEQLRASEQAARSAEQAARKEARESEDRADRIKDEADGEVAKLREQFDHLKIQLEMMTAATARLTDTIISVQTEVWRPEPNIPALRRLVGRPSGQGVNGQQV